MTPPRVDRICALDEMMVVGTMKRKLKWTALVLAVLLLGFGTALLLWPRDRITADSWKQIQIGMSEKEVEDILGGTGLNWEQWLAHHDALVKQFGEEPFDDTGVFLRVPKHHIWEGPPEKRPVRIWCGKHGLLLIEVDLAGRVSFKQFQGIRWTQLNFIERIRDWLGW